MKYKARIRWTTGKPFHLWWSGGEVVSDSSSQAADKCRKYLNGQPLMGHSSSNEGGTDSHWVEPGTIKTEDDFLLTVGSLVDQVEGVLAVDLID